MQTIYLAVKPNITIVNKYCSKYACFQGEKIIEKRDDKNCSPRAHHRLARFVRSHRCVFQSTCVFVFASFLLTAVVALLDWFVQLENARNRLVVKGPGDRFGEKRSHVKLPDFSGKLPLILYGIRYQQVIQVFHVRDALPCPTQRGRAEDPVRRPGVDRTRSQVGEFLDVALERRSGVHEIVDDDALAPLHVPDHLRGVFRFAPSLPVLCDEGELDVLAAQPLKDVPEYGGPGDLPLVRGNHSYFFVAGSEFLIEIRRGDGDRHQVLYRDFGAEESSERVVVEIQAHHVVDSHLLIHLRTASDVK